MGDSKVQCYEWVKNVEAELPTGLPMESSWYRKVGGAMEVQMQRETVGQMNKGAAGGQGVVFNSLNVLNTCRCDLVDRRDV